MAEASVEIVDINSKPIDASPQYQVTVSASGKIRRTLFNAVSAFGVSLMAAANAAAARTILGLDGLLVKTGSIHIWTTNTAPTGYLECNGAAVSRTDYAALFTQIGTVWGVGDGTTTFNVPDFRGEFLRGWDHGRGVDAARAFASAQGDQLKTHDHSFTFLQQSNTTATGAADRVNNIAETGLATTVTTSENTGGGAENRPRNMAVLFIIKT